MTFASFVFSFYNFRFPFVFFALRQFAGSAVPFSKLQVLAVAAKGQIFIFD